MSTNAFPTSSTNPFAELKGFVPHKRGAGDTHMDYKFFKKAGIQMPKMYSMSAHYRGGYNAANAFIRQHGMLSKQQHQPMQATQPDQPKQQGAPVNNGNKKPSNKPVLGGNGNKAGGGRKKNPNARVR